MKSFLYALRGIVKTVLEERNMRVHLCFSFYVLLAGIVTKISESEWIAVLLCIGLVTALECANTAVERLCDAVHPEKAPGIRAAKDTAAGAVLCAAVIAAAVGCVIFFSPEKLGAAYAFLKAQPVISAVIILTLVPAVLFVRGGAKGESK